MRFLGVNHVGPRCVGQADEHWYKCGLLLHGLLYQASNSLESTVRALSSMSIPIYVAGAVIVGIFLYRFMYGTDTPHIKGLPEVPGLPVFGSLYELGTNHAKVAQGWAKKYGPVFQVRMGNRVRNCTTLLQYIQVDIPTENRVRQLLRVRPAPLDHKSVCPHLATHAPHLP